LVKTHCPVLIIIRLFLSTYNVLLLTYYQ